MTRPASLERLRDLAKQRAIRRPLLVPVPDDWAEPQPEAPSETVEWPISR